METLIIIKDQLLDLFVKKLLSKHQHGFMRKHLTATNYLNVLDDCIVGLSKGYNVDIVYFNFSKAFDCICRPIVFSKLFAKLKPFGIVEKTTNMDLMFIHGGTQHVMSENCFHL